LSQFLFSAAFHYLQIDAQEFVEAYREDYPQMKDIEILESGYKKALKYQSDAFMAALLAWLGSGFYLGLLALAITTGVLAVKNWSYLWMITGVLSLASFGSFILMILHYLRKRSIEKALFAIQFKKGDKAEISIKI
jgi:hypothetical protein